MAGVRRGAQAVLKYLAPIFVIAIIVQVFLAGEGIFGLKSVDRISTTRRRSTRIAGLGFFLTFPGALLLLIVALLAWHARPESPHRLDHPSLRALPAVGARRASDRWGGAFHPLNGFAAPRAVRRG